MIWDCETHSGPQGYQRVRVVCWERKVLVLLFESATCHSRPIKVHWQKNTGTVFVFRVSFPGDGASTRGIGSAFDAVGVWCADVVQLSGPGKGGLGWD